MKALVTGASSGIGKEIAIRLAKDGHSLILVARREELLFELKESLNVDVKIIACDLSSSDACLSLYEQVKDLSVDIVVNNAGFGVFGAFDTTSLDAELSMLHLNIDAVHILTKLFYNDFIKKNSGYILNLASSASFMPGPFFSSYYASKAYVLRLTQAIASEIRQQNKNVYVGAVCPGPVRTGFDKAAGVDFSVKGLSAYDVANCAVNGMYKRKTVITPGALMKFVRFLSKILPDNTMAKLSGIMQKKKM